MAESQTFYAPSGDPIRAYTFDNVSGTTVYDEMGNGNATIFSLTKTPVISGGRIDKCLSSSTSDGSSTLSLDIADIVSVRSFSLWSRFPVVGTKIYDLAYSTSGPFLSRFADNTIRRQNGATSYGTIGDTGWHHFVHTISATGAWCLYIDKVLLGSGAGVQYTLQGFGTRVNVVNYRCPELDVIQVYDYVLSQSDVDALYAMQVATVLLRSAVDQLYSLSSYVVRGVLEQTYSLNFRQINTLIQVYGLRMMASLIQPYGNVAQYRQSFEQRYGDCAFLRRMVEHEYGDMPQYRATFDQEWLMPDALRAQLVQRYGIAEAQIRGMCEHLYDLSEHDRVRMLLDQLYVLAAGEAIVQDVDVVIVAETDGGQRVLTSIFNLNVEQDDSLYHMTGELQLLLKDDYLFCRRLETTVTITIDGQSYHYIVEDKRKERTEEGTVYVLVLASSTLLLGHSKSAFSQVSDTMLSGMAKVLVQDLAAPVAQIDWRLLDWFIPPNRLYVNSASRIEVIKRIVVAVGGVVQTGPDGVLICRPEYPVNVHNWATTPADLELADQDNFFSIVPTSEPRDGYNRFFVANKQLGDDGLYIDDIAVSAYEKEIRVSMVPWDDTAGVVLHHSGGPWISIVKNGVKTAAESEQVELVSGAGRVGKPVYGAVAVSWLQRDLGVVTVEEDGTVTAAIAEHSLAQIDYVTKFHSFTLRGDRVEDVQVYPEVI